ncbi:Subtilisin-like protease 8 [Smittium mucronatum]|uniref:Subtilisin-like protease 8 n=1 Tax=Smittium mucronatum TaxID=133383 RepID=A0A1R0H8Z4_9FUNG|nr:Subtilisin-like protease 8 [Smittium mucronatum]
MVLVSANLAPVYHNPNGKVKRDGSSELRDYIVVVSLNIPVFSPFGFGGPSSSSFSDPKSSTWRTAAINLLEQTVDSLKSKLVTKRDTVSSSLDDTKFSVIGSFLSFTGTFDASTVAIIQKMPLVKYVQEAIQSDIFGDVIIPGAGSVSTFQTRQDPIGKRDGSTAYVQRYAPWALSRLVSPALPSPIYPYGDGVSSENAGEGVVVYVMDSGINIDHQEFGGRASLGPNIAYDSSSGLLEEDGYDHVGHGTAVASAVAGATFGLAKKARLVSFKIYADGSGMPDTRAVQALSDITDLINNASDGRTASLVVCSFTSTIRSKVWDEAVTQFAQLGYTYISSAGNNRGDGCVRSPVGSNSTVAVGGTDSTDNFYISTNYGPCVDLYAPGVNVYTAINTNNYGFSLSTGTSFSAPVVAGICACMLSNNPSLTQSDIKAKLISASAKNVLRNLPAKSYNYLAQITL